MTDWEAVTRFFSFTPVEYFWLGAGIAWVVGGLVVLIITVLRPGEFHVMMYSDKRLLRLARVVSREMQYRGFLVSLSPSATNISPTLPIPDDDTQ